MFERNVFLNLMDAKVTLSSKSSLASVSSPLSAIVVTQRVPSSAPPCAQGL